MENKITDQNNGNELMQMALNTLDKYYKAMNTNDLEGTLDMIHSSSPSQLPSRQILGELMSVYKLNNELLESKYIGHDHDYLYLRIKQKTIKMEGPDFQNNISDSIFAMKKDSGIWKVWSVMSMDTNVL